MLEMSIGYLQLFSLVLFATVTIVDGQNVQAAVIVSDTNTYPGNWVALYSGVKLMFEYRQSDRTPYHLRTGSG
jgi:hypothetical protein